jgi:hypothetical protein
MVNDWPSMKFPVPHLGHDDMIVFESDVIKQWDGIYLWEKVKKNVIKCDLRQKHNRKETRTIHIGILCWYSVQTDFNEQE